MDRAERTAVISLLTHAGLAALTALLAFLSGNAAVVSLSLLFSAGLAASGLAWAGRRVSGRAGGPLPPVAWNLALAAAGAGLLSAAAAVVLAPASRAVGVPVPALVACGVSAVALAALARREQAVGRETDSRGLVASGACSWLSAAGAALAGGALAAERAGVPLDRAGSLAVTALAGVVGAGALAGAARGLLTGRRAEGVFPVRIGRGRASARRGRRTLGSRVRRAGDEITHPAHRRRTAGIASAIALAAWSLTTASVVGPDHIALVSGRGAVREAGPGLLVTLPWPIERVERVEAGGVFRSSVGRPEAPTPSEGRHAGGLSRLAASLGVPIREAAQARPARVERTFLTGDGRLVAVDAAVHYRVKDHAAFRTAAVDPEAVVVAALESAVAAAAATHPLEALVTGDRRGIEDAARLDVAATLGALRFGVDVQSVQVVRALPPEDALGALGAPATARDDAERAVIGETERATLSLSAARLEAFETVSSAKRYSVERARLAQRGASGFLALAAAHRSAPSVVETRLAFDAIEALLVGREKWVLGDGAAVDGLDPAPCDSALSPGRAWTR